MTEGKWAPPEHPEVPIWAILGLESDAIGGTPVPLSPPQPVRAWVTFEGLGRHRVAAFAVASTDVAVEIETGFQGRRQRAWVPRAGVTRRTLRPRRPD